jgi:succinylglutamate desuccinylase
MKIAVVCCLHGNEPYGLEVIKKLPSHVTSFIGNKKALKSRKRFIDQDLNRSFPGSLKGNHEEKIAYEFTKKLEDFDYVIDIHSSSNDCPVFGIISKPNREKIEFAKRLGLKRLVVMTEDFEKNNALIDWVRCGLSLEIGPHDRKENINDVLKLIENFLENKNKEDNLEIFKIFDVIEKKAENIVIHNFDSVKKGDLIAIDKNKKQYAEYDFTGILVGEKSYRGVLGLAGKRIKDVCSGTVMESGLRF